MFSVARNTHHADTRSLPQFLMLEFGDSHVKARAQTILQTAQHLPLVFERLRISDVNFQREETDRHFSVSLPKSSGEGSPAAEIQSDTAPFSMGTRAEGGSIQRVMRLATKRDFSVKRCALLRRRPVAGPHDPAGSKVPKVAT